jgi:hypothetical protein
MSLQSKWMGKGLTHNFIYSDSNQLQYEPSKYIYISANLFYDGNITVEVFSNGDFPDRGVYTQDWVCVPIE